MLPAMMDLETARLAVLGALIGVLVMVVSYVVNTMLHGEVESWTS